MPGTQVGRGVVVVMMRAIKQIPERVAACDPESKPPEAHTDGMADDGAGNSSEAKTRLTDAADRRPVCSVPRGDTDKPGRAWVASGSLAPHEKRRSTGAMRTYEHSYFRVPAWRGAETARPVLLLIAGCSVCDALHDAQHRMQAFHVSEIPVPKSETFYILE